jgi:AcrR family transcriptional regulator
MQDTAVGNMKEKIVQESIKLFLRKSFKGTSIQDITESVHISKGAFYWHFRSKNELLQMIVDEYETGYVDQFIKAVESVKGDFIKKFKFSHKFATEFAYRNRDRCVGFMTLAAELSGSGTAAERKIKAIYSKYRDCIQKLVDQGKAEKVVRKDVDSNIASHVINAIHNGMLLEWYMNRKEIDGRLLAKTYREVELRGILT